VLNLSIAENVTLSKLKGFGPFGLLLSKNRNRATQKWIDQLDIRCLGPSQHVIDLSGGNQQKVALARLLQHDVDILLLDEATKGIDVGAKAKIYQVIDQLTTDSENERQKPKAILMISSYLPELLGVCDQVAVMHRGKLSEVKPSNQLDEHKLMLAATGQGEL
jgi:ribose transport system ATP-binding protein